MQGPGHTRQGDHPFLLARVKDLTGGDSLDSNIQLVYKQPFTTKPGTGIFAWACR